MPYRSLLALGIASLAACATAVPAEGSDAQAGRDGSSQDDARIDAPPQIDAFCGTIEMELLTNPAFDTAPPWVESRIDQAFPIVASSPGVAALSAPNRARLGGFARARAINQDQLHQDVAIPANAMDLTLSGSYRIATLEILPGQYDLGQVDLSSTSNNPIEVVIALDDDDASSAWTPFTKTFASAHAGESVRVRLTSSSDSSDETSFYFDSLSLKATVPATACP